MPNISYYPVDELTDPELRGYIDHAAQHGTPRPESQAIRAHVPAVLRAFSRVWDVGFRNGVMDHSIKELCRLYVSRTVECDYCGSQRSERGQEQGLTEEHVDELLEFERSDRYDEREKAALAFASVLVWAPQDADAALFARLREHFTEEQITELGYFVSATFGQQRWIPTLGIDHGEVLNITNAGMAPGRLGAPSP